VQPLQSRAQFQAILAGQTVARTPHFALHQLHLPVSVPKVPDDGVNSVSDLFPSPGVWLGAMVPKRWAKRAVTRNAIKRQVYVLSDQLELQLPVAAYVLRLRAAFDKKQFVSATSELLKQAVRTELHTLFARVALPIKPSVAEVCA
jgi:ribonuclease P protein component